MTIKLYLPTGYYHANMLFSGASVPQGAAMTFGGAHTSGTPAAHAAAINTAWNTHIRPTMMSDITLAGTRVKHGPMDDGPFSYVASGIAGGAGAGAVGPPSVAYLIRKLTAMGGRKGAGRLFQPGVAEANVDNSGAVLGSFLTTLQTAWTAFLNGLNSVSLPMYLIHSDGTYLTIENGEAVTRVVTAVMPTEVTSLSVDGRVATQRRRLR